VAAARCVIYDGVDAGLAYQDLLEALLVGWPSCPLIALDNWLSYELNQHPDPQLAAFQLKLNGQARRS
jgi:hypothetical protein